MVASVSCQPNRRLATKKKCKVHLIESLTRNFWLHWILPQTCPQQLIVPLQLVHLRSELLCLRLCCPASTGRLLWAADVTPTLGACIQQAISNRGQHGKEQSSSLAPRVSVAKRGCMWCTQIGGLGWHHTIRADDSRSALVLCGASVPHKSAELLSTNKQVQQCKLPRTKRPSPNVGALSVGHQHRPSDMANSPVLFAVESSMTV